MFDFSVPACLSLLTECFFKLLDGVLSLKESGVFIILKQDKHENQPVHQELIIVSLLVLRLCYKMMQLTGTSAAST
jgi:hypothetical protein